MEWAEDPDIWTTLDELLRNMKNDLKDFLDVLHRYNSELSMPIKALLFGGMGQLTIAYEEARKEANEPKEAFTIALEQMSQNPLFATLMAQTVNMAVDNKVAEMV